MNDPFLAGQQAFLDGKKLSQNPLKGKDARKWCNGWFDQRSKEKNK